MRIGKLTALQVQRASKRGMLNDGAGLYLQVAEGGSKSWVLRFKRGGRARHFGIGPLHTVGLAEARQRAAEARLMLLDGKDPIEVRRSARAAAARSMTFSECATQFIADHRSGWRNARHAQQWERTIATFAEPVIGGMPVQAIATEHVMGVLGDLWKTRPETASRLRGRIELVLDWARVRGLRAGENPARWRGHLDHLLPRRGKVRAVAHHPALPYRELGVFMTDLRKREGVSVRALEFAILTATRTSETLKAQWGEFDPAGRLWTLPPMRTKAAREHRIPLSDRALKILEEMATIRKSDFVFPSRRGRPLADKAMLIALGRLRDDVTPHGFRSSFRDWVAEQTSFPAELAEMALGHKVGSAVERAYARSDLFEKRRALMDAWASHCEGEMAGGGKVVRLWQTS